MKAFYKSSVGFSIVMVVIFLSSFHPGYPGHRILFPYKQAGLSDRQAAAHLLSRFTFGARPGQIDEVVKMGPEKWFEQQLQAGLADTDLNNRLSGYEALKWSNTDIVNTYLKPAQLLRTAARDGIINRDSINNPGKQGYREA